MITRLNQPWIPVERIESFVQIEPALLIFGLAFMSYLFYGGFLSHLSEERHRLLKKQFKSLLFNLVSFSVLLGLFVFLRAKFFDNTPLQRLGAYIGLFALITEATAFTRICKIVVNLYLFFRSPRAGVPVVLVNFVTLTIWLLLAGWIVTEVFNLKIAPLLATSAVFSLVLGLALQDTLGNLIAGIALQIDKPYEIGDWIEVQQGDQKTVGQVQEISWRATVLLAFTEEIITVPNRVMAQAEVSNFSAKIRPFYRGLNIRVRFEADLARARQCLLDAVAADSAVCKSPAPLCFAKDTSDSYMTLRLVYAISDYGMQYVIADRLLRDALTRLEAAGIPLARPEMRVNMVGAEQSPT